jgi:hypothetical protein
MIIRIKLIYYYVKWDLNFGIAFLDFCLFYFDVMMGFPMHIVCVC